MTRYPKTIEGIAKWYGIRWSVRSKNAFESSNPEYKLIGTPAERADIWLEPYEQKLTARCESNFPRWEEHSLHEILHGVTGPSQLYEEDVIVPLEFAWARILLDSLGPAILHACEDMWDREKRVDGKTGKDKSQRIKDAISLGFLDEGLMPLKLDPLPLWQTWNY